VVRARQEAEVAQRGRGNWKMVVVAPSHKREKRRTHVTLEV